MRVKGRSGVSPRSKVAIIALVVVVEEWLTGGLLWQLLLGMLLALGVL